MSQQQGNDLAAPEPLANTEPDKSAQGIEDKLNLESEHALLLEEAYQLGYHKVRNGCLIPLTKQLEAIITTETTNAYNKGYDDCLKEHGALFKENQ